MAVRDDFAAGEVLAAADLNDTFASKLDLAGGKILQIVRATDTSDRSTTSVSLADVTGMSVTITPQKNDSTIILWFTVQCESISTASTGNHYGRLTIADSSNNAIQSAEDVTVGNTTQSAAADRSYDSPIIVGYSTPATTSATTYKLRFRTGSTSNTFTLKNSVTTAQMYAIEVSA